MRITPDEVRARTVSEAWLRAVELVNARPDRSAYHLVVRIERPGEEIEGIRRLADQLLLDLSLPLVETVRNTIFPAPTADRFSEPARLAKHYRIHYPAYRRFKGNKRGTYFGRLVALPDGNGGVVDQLTNVVSKLRERRRMSSRYELNIYLAREDRNVAMGFPCMSNCAMHLDKGVLHLAASYRNQYLIERGYGNYLGLGQLLQYVSHATGLQAGELLIIAGHADVDHANKGQINSLLAAAGLLRGIASD